MTAAPIFELRDAISAALKREKIPEREAKQLQREEDEHVLLDGGEMARGLYLPDRVVRDLTAGSATGAYLVSGNDITDWLPALRNSSTVTRAGARVFQAPGGNFRLPVVDDGGVAYIVTEGVAPTDADAVIRELSASPKIFSKFQDATKALVAQSPVAAEMLVANLVGAVIELYDAMALKGSGAAGQPLGVANHPDVNTAVNLTSWADVCAVHETSELAHAGSSTFGWIMHPTVAKLLRQLDKGTDTGRFVMDENNRIGGYPTFLTTALDSDEAIFGPWAEVCLVRWGKIDLLVNGFSQSKAGVAEFSVFMYADAMVRRGELFTYVDQIA